MPSLKTALLLNARGRITLHVCVRLEIRPVLRSHGIFPIYKCAITGSERDFGCMRNTGTRRLIKSLYPGIPLEEVELTPEDDLAETIDDLAEVIDDLSDSASSTDTEIAA